MTLVFPELRDEMVERLRRFVALSSERSAEKGEVDDLVEFFVGVLEQFRHRKRSVGQLFLTLLEMDAVDAFIDELERVSYMHPDLDEELLQLPEWDDVARAARTALVQLAS